MSCMNFLPIRNYEGSYTSLAERTPYKVPFLSTKLRKLAREIGVEDILNASIYEQRIKRARVNGAKNK